VLTRPDESSGRLVEIIREATGNAGLRAEIEEYGDGKGSQKIVERLGWYLIAADKMRFQSSSRRLSRAEQ
jgi:hypothetical protein